MKKTIAIGTKSVEGPFGGVNQFVTDLSRFLKDKDWTVTQDLNQDNLDIILLTVPDSQLKTSAFNHIDIAKYLLKNPQTTVIHRLNDCDERKNTQGVNDFLMLANEIADKTIFISHWLKNLFQRYKNFNEANSTVIHNGADNTIFHSKNYQSWNPQQPLRLVTHHWGGNLLKGFDIYKILDDLMTTSVEGHQIHFTYIGNVPEDFQFKNADVIPPLSGTELAEKIKESHIYVTGSQNEPGGMHHIEGSLCGLPLLYRKSGALTEHCEDYGVGFEGPADFLEQLRRLIDHYETHQKKIQDYIYTSQRMCQGYENYFSQVIENKSATSKRGFFHKIKTLYQLFKFIKHKRKSHDFFKALGKISERQSTFLYRKTVIRFLQSQFFNNLKILKSWRNYPDVLKEIKYKCYRLFGTKHQQIQLHQLKEIKKTDTAFIFGCGYSLNDISSEEFQRIEKHTTIAFSDFAFRQSFLRLDIQMIIEVYYPTEHIKKDIYPLKHLTPINEYLDGFRQHLLNTKKYHEKTTWVMTHTPNAYKNSRLLHEEVIPKENKFCWFKMRRSLSILPSNHFNEGGLARANCSLTLPIDLAQLMGFKNIVLVGIDLYDLRYFFLGEDELHPSLKREFGDIDPRKTIHKTASQVDYAIPRWREALNAQGKELWVHNPRSLLSQYLPTWQWDTKNKKNLV